MRTFKLLRNKDVSGVSGTGFVAEGALLHDGKAVLSWYGKHHATTIYDDGIDEIVAIHGHDGATEVVFDDEAGEPE